MQFLGGGRGGVRQRPRRCLRRPGASPRRPAAALGGMQARGGKGAPVPFPQGGYGKTAPTFREGGQDVDKVGRLAER